MHKQKKFLWITAAIFLPLLVFALWQIFKGKATGHLTVEGNQGELVLFSLAVGGKVVKGSVSVEQPWTYSDTDSWLVTIAYVGSDKELQIYRGGKFYGSRIVQ